ncbi:hypothetical protein TRAPUB_7961 [Trametes pubescens]|uniref:Uncharacterized protein n=1 Tax=Trametes pubescens TaxID=154538 RepID=A0A1M2V1U1_TRAPU|nr:hypothetical protein TRAPUB_7961 [Trametes pubescens]
MRDALGNQGSTATTDTSPFRSTLLRDNRLPDGRPKRGTLRFGFSNTSSEPPPAIELKITHGLSRDTAMDVIKTEHRVDEDPTALVAA